MHNHLLNILPVSKSLRCVFWLTYCSCGSSHNCHLHWCKHRALPVAPFHRWHCQATTSWLSVPILCI